MRHTILLASEAVDDLRWLSARDRALARDAMERYLRDEPARVARSSIKRMRGVSRPQYRLRAEDDWFDYRLEHDTRFLGRVAAARASIRDGRAVPLEDVTD